MKAWKGQARKSHPDSECLGERGSDREEKNERVKEATTEPGPETDPNRSGARVGSRQV